MLKLFVDDYREPPEGFHLAKTITEAIRILSGPIEVSVVSLDHDIIYREGKHSFSEETFATVARYIAIMPKERLPKIVYLHTANEHGAEDMEAILNGIVTTIVISGSYDLSRKDYKEQILKLEQEREANKNG
jgi:hypothetical protein